MSFYQKPLKNMLELPICVVGDDKNKLYLMKIFSGSSLKAASKNMPSNYWANIHKVIKVNKKLGINCRFMVLGGELSSKNNEVKQSCLELSEALLVIDEKQVAILSKDDSYKFALKRTVAEKFGEELKKVIVTYAKEQFPDLFPSNQQKDSIKNNPS